MNETKPMTNRIERDVLALRLDLISAREALHRALKYGVEGTINRAKAHRDSVQKALVSAIAPYKSFREFPEIEGKGTQKEFKLISTHNVVAECYAVLEESPLDDPCFLDDVRETPEWEGIEGAL
jgi:hypothetical protein